jgi:hypothetical protein
MSRLRDEGNRENGENGENGSTQRNGATEANGMTVHVEVDEQIRWTIGEAHITSSL